MTHDPRRAEIGQQILLLLAGLPHGLALDIQADVLGVSVGAVCHMAGATQDDAIYQISIVKDNAIQHAITNWGRIQTMGRD